MVLGYFAGRGKKITFVAKITKKQIRLCKPNKCNETE